MKNTFFNISISTNQLSEVENEFMGIAHAADKAHVHIAVDAKELHAARQMAENILEQIQFIQECAKTEQAWNELTANHKDEIKAWEAKC